MSSRILSELVWQNDIEALNDILNKLDRNDPEVDYIKSLDEWDHRGNTPLHLALMLGRSEAARLLMKAGSSCSAINADGSDAIEEALRFGDRKMLQEVIQRSFEEDAKSLIKKNGPWQNLNECLPQGYFEVEVKLKSKVPVIAKICPQDTIKIWKSKDSVRVDWGIAKVIGFKIVRARMSFVGRILDGDLVRAAIVNHDDKIYENIMPSPSTGIIHDLVDSFMRYGIVKDEIPIHEYEWKAAQAQFSGKDKTKHIKKGNYSTNVFKLDNLSWLQRLKVPVFENVHYEECTDNCRTSHCVKDYLKSTATALDDAKHKIDTLEALQFVSESDLMAEDKAEELFKNGPEEPTEKEIGFIEKAFKEKLGRISKHVRSATRNSVMFKPKAETSVDTRQTVATHMKSTPYKDIMDDISYEEYFDQQDDFNSNTVGREWDTSQIEYSRDKPILLYMCKDFHVSISDLLPILEWILAKSIPEGKLKHFIQSNNISGFPVRVEIPIVSMLALKITVTKFTKDFKVPGQDFFDVPDGYKPSDILPFVSED